MAGNYPGFSLRASEAPPAILGPLGAARRLPGPKNPIFLKLALLISELLLGRPWSSWSVPGTLLGSPEPPRLPQAPQDRGNLSATNRDKPGETRRNPEISTLALETLRPAKESQNPSSFGWPGKSRFPRFRITFRALQPSEMLYKLSQRRAADSTPSR